MLIQGIECQFNNAMATNTRLMGVVGIVATYHGIDGQVITQIFHLDYESYGIDGYHVFVDGDEKEIEVTVKGVTGGLGGHFFEVTFDEFIFLLKSAYVIDESALDYLVDFEHFTETFESLYADLTINQEIALYDKLCPEMSSDEMVVNYFIMRYVGCDYPSTQLLWDEGEIDDIFELSSEPSTLLKNTLTKTQESLETCVFKCESLVDFDDKYRLLVTEIELKKVTQKVVRAKLVETLTLSSIEASFNLNKPEYMMVLTVKDAFFERRFSDMNPELMAGDYYNGKLYTEFNRDNAHVGENPYYLNGDLYALYFFTRTGQMVIVSFEQSHLEEIEAELQTSDVYDNSLQYICEIKTDNPVFYTFVNSSYDNLFDFLDYVGR